MCSQIIQFFIIMEYIDAYEKVKIEYMYKNGFERHGLKKEMWPASKL